MIDSDFAWEAAYELQGDAHASADGRGHYVVYRGHRYYLLKYADLPKHDAFIIKVQQYDGNMNETYVENHPKLVAAAIEGLRAG